VWRAAAAASLCLALAACEARPPSRAETAVAGFDGRSTGVPFAAKMSPPIPSLASPEVQGYADGQLRRIIVGGLWPSGMPASRGILNDEEIWSIVRFLRHLPPAGSLGEPPVVYGGGPSPR
jgi:hypothetical protein